MKTNPRFIISGGGTGGHIFPALAIADALKALCPGCEILFVGALGRMEMERVPAAGYEIKGLPVAGLQRKLSIANLALPFKVLNSLSKAKSIIREFKPDVVVGVGGYASAPVLWSASSMGIPCLIQEQNSFAGLTNKILGKKVDKICVAYDGMEKFFPSEKIIFTGNPVRKNIAPPTAEQRAEGYSFYGLDPQKKTLLIVGGSLGARTLNTTMKQWIASGQAAKADFQVLWQSGKFYKNDVETFLKDKNVPNVKNVEFVTRMDLAYAVADILISRAGASTISELCICGKATIFVPSPNVAEDHQTHNAMSLVNKDAAMIVPDAEATEKLMDSASTLIHDEAKIAKLEKNVILLGKKNADEVIASEVLKLVK